MSPTTPILAILLTACSLTQTAHAAQGNGGERSGRPIRLLLGCESEPTDSCQAHVSVSAPAGGAPTARITRECRGQRKISFSGAPVQVTPADLSKAPFTPLAYSGNGFRISAAFSEIPDLEHSSQVTLSGQLEIRVGNHLEKQAVRCQFVPANSQVILPTFHRDHITALKLITEPGQQPYEAKLEVSYYRRCGYSHLHVKLSPVVKGNETRCDEKGNCVGSTGTLTGINAEVLALSGAACQGADIPETTRVPLAELVAFRGLPPNGLEGLELIPLQP